MAVDRKQLLEDADVLADMAQRIRSNGGEPNYCGEKAERAAKAAVRIIGRCDAAVGTPGGWDGFGESLRLVYDETAAAQETGR